MLQVLSFGLTLSSDIVDPPIIFVHTFSHWSEPGVEPRSLSLWYPLPHRDAAHKRWLYYLISLFYPPYQTTSECVTVIITEVLLPWLPPSSTYRTLIKLLTVGITLFSELNGRAETFIVYFLHDPECGFKWITQSSCSFYCLLLFFAECSATYAELSQSHNNLFPPCC